MLDLLAANWPALVDGLVMTLGVSLVGVALGAPRPSGSPMT